MSSTLVIHAHPRPGQSVVTQALFDALAPLEHTALRSLYALYPDFDIDVAAEQEALSRADLVIWLAPVHWYSVPALLKHWVDQVLAHGWAYGQGADALRGKTAWWVASAGGALDTYAPGGVHMRPFADFVAPIEHTARFCGMHWLPPFVVHGGHSCSTQQLADARSGLLAQLAQHLATRPSTAAPSPVSQQTTQVHP
jgi:glutathione-regulated potassium-efflux system ancillary protein KefF